MDHIWTVVANAGRARIFSRERAGKRIRNTGGALPTKTYAPRTRRPSTKPNCLRAVSPALQGCQHGKFQRLELLAGPQLRQMPDPVVKPLVPLALDRDCTRSSTAQLRAMLAAPRPQWAG